MTWDDTNTTGVSGVLGSKQGMLGNFGLGFVPTLTQDPGVTNFWFTPPAGRFRIPPRRRLDALGVPKSKAFRNAFFKTNVAEAIVGEGTLVVGGIAYPGGRWYGPLTQEQVEALNAEGYGDRIFPAEEVGDLQFIFDGA